MALNYKNTPKVILTSEKETDTTVYLSSQEKLYRMGNILLNARIIILPESINKNISKKSYLQNTPDNIDKDIFEIIRYLQDKKVLKKTGQDETYESLQKKYKLYKLFSSKSRSYWERKTKQNLIEIYSDEGDPCELDFLTKTKIIDLFLTNPIKCHFYSHGNKYFVSNSSEPNMGDGFRFSPIKDVSIYEYIFKMFSVTKDLEYYEDLPYYFKKFRNDNIMVIINFINVLCEPFRKSYLLRLFMFMVEDGLKDIFGDNREQSARIIQKNWRIYKYN